MTKAPLTLIANVQLDQECQTERNGLAYSAEALIAIFKKVCYTYPLAACTIKLFTVVIRTAAFLAKKKFYQSFSH